jgi:lipopolysaccharide transport system ATP-binding protein
MLFEGGQLVREGGVQELIREYHRRIMPAVKHGATALAERDGPGRKEKVFHSLTLLNEAGQPSNYLPLGGSLRARIGLQAKRPIDHPTLTIGIDDTLGQRLLSLVTPVTKPFLRRLEGRCEIECRVDHFPLAPGEYWMKLGLAAGGAEIDDVERALPFTIVNANAFGEGRGIHRGVCVAPPQWRLC